MMIFKEEQVTNGVKEDVQGSKGVEGGSQGVLGGQSRRLGNLLGSSSWFNGYSDDS